ncbi:hypothetical protein J2Y66_004367 [Paenarthrobacter nitroguajacolicus]|uniref:hypothetical protein n=1 Tax=Paenarthrobacter nitroguajacolicus TaxID=211146 RepID=UPI00286756C4|nr:hypothetical protein [Paenarthrobacter nitroguajacolicus]MDR6989850.1 hypothetical protein [Paenarthrobacter nitroguajacolicus]
MIHAELTKPSPTFRKTWLESYDEWGTLDQDSSPAFLAARYDVNLREDSGFTRWVQLLHRMPLTDFQPPEGLATQTTTRVVDGMTCLGSARRRPLLQTWASPSRSAATASLCH